MKKVFVALACAALCGCTAYPKKVRTVKTQLAMGVDEAAPVEYRAESLDGKNALLALQEQGRLWQLQGFWRKSAECYRKAMNFCDKESSGAVVSVGNTLRHSLASTYGNDLGLQYPIVPFEQMMLHTLDAFNALALSEWDNFGVNVRNIEAWRNGATEQMARDVKDLTSKLGDKSDLLTSSKYSSAVNNANCVVYGLKRSTDNIYALYLSALYHEIIGDYSNALIAWNDIEQIRPGLGSVKRGIDHSNGKAMEPGMGEVVMFFEEGFIPQKRNKRFEYGGLFTTIVSDMPYYSVFDCQPYVEGGPIVASEDGHGVAMTTPLCDLAGLAVKAHQERLGGIMARQYARTSIKAITRGIFSGLALAGAYCAANNIRDDKGYLQNILLIVGIVGSIGTSIMAISTEHADLRSWLLLPRQIQIARFPMKAGNHRLKLETCDLSEEVDVEVKPGRITVVHCTAVPNVMKAFSVCTDKIK